VTGILPLFLHLVAVVLFHPLLGPVVLPLQIVLVLIVIVFILVPHLLHPCRKTHLLTLDREMGVKSNGFNYWFFNNMLGPNRD
jgi:hypothetical protein